MLPTRLHAEKAIAVDKAEGVLRPDEFALLSSDGFEPLPRPSAGDWISSYPREFTADDPLQSFSQFLNELTSLPPCQPREKIKLVQMGPSTEWVDLAFLASVLRAFFGLEVIVDDEPIVVTTTSDGKAVRIEHSYGGVMQCTARGEKPQVLVTHLTRYASKRLKPSRGRRTELIDEDSPVRAVLIVTSLDLYAPDLEYIFGFGHADVGVYSYARLHGRLRSLVHLMLHETLHIFGFKHCRYYKCVMNGSNSLDELKQHPLLCCPVDLHKLRVALPHLDLIERYKRLYHVFSTRMKEFSVELQFIRTRLILAGESKETLEVKDNAILSTPNNTDEERRKENESKRSRHK